MSILIIRKFPIENRISRISTQTDHSFRHFVPSECFVTNQRTTMSPRESQSDTLTFGKATTKAFEGAYFARHLERARKDGRIGHVAVDPVLPVKAFFDIGGAGHSSDAIPWLGIVETLRP